MTSSRLESIRVVDSHTGGEPTRVVVEGGPPLGNGSLAERRRRFGEEFDAVRAAIVDEPRGSDVLVGALLVEPVDPTCTAGVIYFNNVGPLNMCGHGTIGVAVTLGHVGRIDPGRHRLETPVGVVEIEYHGDNRVTFENVPAYRTRADVPLTLDDGRTVHGDLAWGGNWFFLVKDHGECLELANVERLSEVAWQVRYALEREGIAGEDGGEIDHVELIGPPADPANDARNFVLCPGGAYDRSPCGTGTSAKLACLAAEGALRPGDVWRQESIIGSLFEGTYRLDDSCEGRIVPRVTGSAFVTAEATLLLDPADPFRMGIRK